MELQKIEKVLLKGDLSALGDDERIAYYKAVCESLGLNPLTRPFEYIVLNGRLTLYARRDATDQIRKRDGISIEITSRERVDELYIVSARATTPDGRRDEAIGAVSIAGLRGDELANAIMKAETKAKRRVTLSISGLGWLDETEVETVPDTRVVDGEKTPVEAEKLPYRQKLIGRLNELIDEAQGLTNGKRYNPFHLRNHLAKHYGVETIDELSDEQLIAFGKHLAEEVDGYKRARDMQLEIGMDEDK